MKGQSTNSTSTQYASSQQKAATEAKHERANTQKNPKSTQGQDDDVKRFQQSLHKNIEPAQGRDEYMPNPEDILQDILHHAHQPVTQGERDQTASKLSTQNSEASSQQELANLVSRLVDKLWVRTDSAQQQTIKLDLKHDLLPNTELTVSKIDNQLTVQFATSAAASYQHLTANRAQLVQHLQRRYGQHITVNIEQLNASPTALETHQHHERSPAPANVAAFQHDYLANDDLSESNS